jgi:DNA-binding NtrC family response regulator
MTSSTSTTPTALKLATPAPDSQTRWDELKEFFSDDCPLGVTLAGKSPAMLDALHTLRMVAESQCNPVLIVGPTGTGKEHAAQAIHAWRNGRSRQFLAVNCAALSSNLLESELFGHVRGAFTGADRDKTGLFEAAGEGTIFLDEISEMPLDMQAKLLRVLQERSFRKVGGTQDLPCYATVVASSNRDLLAEVQAGRFRQDLYYRLAVFPIRMPALADNHRHSDILLLANFFLKTAGVCPNMKKTGLSTEAEQKLLAHDWPGNVRELRNVISRALILERQDTIQSESIMLDHQIHTAIAPKPPQAAEALDPKDLSLETAERMFIQRALQETGWQRTKAAGLLGITRATLHSKLKRYGITPPDQQAQTTNDEEPDDALAEACA